MGDPRRWFLRVVLAARGCRTQPPRGQHHLDTGRRTARRHGRGVQGAPPAGRPPAVELVRGEIDAFLVERYHIWDHAPWILLVQEAGGRFTDRTGGAAGDQGGGLYSNANLHGLLLSELGYPARP
ncbi:inositol monophosphatase family protein [Allocatelliglobosispora scoriae]|uniref:inositol monophosphatase family protein n=1 Tax=Allocatelliglobosispora scoriae TaxID=643052 RepID=UPI00160998C4